MTTLATGLAIGLALVTSVVLAGDKKGGTKHALKLNVSLAEKDPQLIAPGGEIEASYALKNRSPRKGKAGRLRFFLSADKKKKGPDIALSPAVRLGWLKGKEKEKGDVSLRVPDEVTASSRSEEQAQRVTTRDGLGQRRSTSGLRLLACAGSVCGATGRTITIGPGSPVGGGSTAPGGSSSGTSAPPSTAGSSGGSPPPSTTMEVTGQVLYTARQCRAGAASTAPLGGAQVKLVPSTGQPETVPLDDAGRFRPTTVTGTGPIHAFAVTDGWRISVTPDTTLAQPYEIPLGTVTPGSSQTLLIGNGDGNTQPDPASGAASIFTRLDLAAQYAERVSPVALPKVRARWRYMADLSGWLGDKDGSQYAEPGDEILVGGLLDGGKRDEWESFPLLHEYGHHVHTYVANAPGKDGSHNFHSVHRERPAVAFSEGYAHAFASAALDEPRLTLGCEVRMDLAAKPAVADDPERSGTLLEPAPASAPHLAQYNETAVAGAIRAAAIELGDGSLRAGMADLLDAMKRFNDRYHAPKDMLELRDALTEFADRDDTELQQRLGNAFDDHRLRWGFRARVVSRSQGGQGSFWGELHLRAHGPICDMSHPHGFYPNDPAFTGPMAEDGSHWHQIAWDTGEGPLPYTRHDECWLTVDNDWPNPELETLVQTLPYLDGQGHRVNTTTIYALWACSHSGCASAIDATIEVGTGVWHRPGGGAHIEAAAPANPKSVNVVVPAYTSFDGWPPPESAGLPIAEIDALGNCTTLIGPARDCGS